MAYPLIALYEESIRDFEDSDRGDVLRAIGNRPLSSFPWSEEGSEQEGHFQRFKQELQDQYNVACYVFISPMRAWASRGRGNPDTRGFMVDTEVYYDNGSEDDVSGSYFYHNEKHFPDWQQALSYLNRITTFLDSKTLSQLVQSKKSGKFAMSKFESRFSRLFHGMRP